MLLIGPTNIKKFPQWCCFFFFHPTFSQGSRVGQFSPQVQKSYRHSVDKMVSLLFSQSTGQSVSCWQTFLSLRSESKKGGRKGRRMKGRMKRKRKKNLMHISYKKRRGALNTINTSFHHFICAINSSVSSIYRSVNCAILCQIWLALWYDEPCLSF